ncbi:MAG: PfaB family protein, partial [Pseudomonadales bacterium]|nr:PfaB family protein [Pseudomonadales bacterium]
NLHKISECGVGMGYLLTKAFRDQFNFQPNAGVGYSMGEISMYVALDAWTDPGCLSEPLADHPTFKQNITGELFALKEYWGLSKSDESGTQLWNTYSLRGDPANVAKAVAEEEKVFLTIINTPDNMLIGGDPDACQRVVKALGTRAMSLQLASAIHSAPAKIEYDRIVDLYSIEVNERSLVRYYSTSVYKPVPHRSKAIAHSIAKSFTEQVDFPKLIGQMVDSGVKVFVEMGADRSCSTWIEKILKHDYADMPHVCVPVNARGTDDHITIVRALAKLVSHQVDIDISSLFGSFEK